MGVLDAAGEGICELRLGRGESAAGAIDEPVAVTLSPIRGIDARSPDPQGREGDDAAVLGCHGACFIRPALRACQRLTRSGPSKGRASRRGLFNALDVVSGCGDDRCGSVQDSPIETN